MLSDQFTGLNAIPVPGTLRDSLVLLAVVLEQQTEAEEIKNQVLLAMKVLGEGKQVAAFNLLKRIIDS